MQTINIEFVREPDAQDLPVPEPATPDSAGSDLRAAVTEPVTLEPGRFRPISTGLRIRIPSGYEAQVRPRSGLALRHGITCLNSPGTIDADFRGVVQVLLINHGSDPFVINRGDRIAQIVFSPVTQGNFVEVESLDDTQRGEGGFGHTGVK